MALVPLPQTWLRRVEAILRAEDTRRIDWTADARRRFEADFLAEEAWTYEVYPALRAAFALPGIAGCPITMQRPVGETWEFYFTFKNRRCYGKILLRSDQNSLILFSAHAPLKSTLSCE